MNYFFFIFIGFLFYLFMHVPTFPKKTIKAIEQVIKHLDDIGPNHTHQLYAVSAIGKRWRACYTLKGKGSKGGQPVKGIAVRSSLRSAHPDCWNKDIASKASYIALQRIVDKIKSRL